MLGKFDEGSFFIVFIVSDKVITISYLAVTTSLALIIMIDANEFVKYYIEEEYCSLYFDYYYSLRF